MKRISCILLCVILLIASSSAIANTREVGGDTLEDAVQRMTGYSLQTDEKGNQMIVSTELATKYYFENSDNGIAVLPNMTSFSGGMMNILCPLVPTEYKAVDKIIITTNQNEYTITLDITWDCSTKETQGNALIATPALEEAIMDMCQSENVAIEFIGNQGTDERIILSEEQLYLLHQYYYAYNTFLIPRVTAQGEKAKESALALLAAFGGTPYTVTSEVHIPTVHNELPLPTEGEESIETATDAVSVTDEIREYKKLLDEGIITQEEFDAKKKELLGL